MNALRTCFRYLLLPKRGRRLCLLVPAAVVALVMPAGSGNSAGYFAGRPTQASVLHRPPQNQVSNRTGHVGIGNQWPHVGAAPPDHHNVLVIGDSLMGNTQFWLPRVLSKYGLDATVYDAHVNGSGLLDPINGLAPLEYVRAQVSAHPDVDTVIIEWAGACTICLPGGTLIYGSPEFYARWRANAHAIIDYLHASSEVNGLATPPHLLWVTSPPMPPHPEDPTGRYQLLTNGAQVLSMIDTVELAPASGGGVDWRAALSDTNEAYQQVLFYDGAPHQVRADDTVHLTEDGAYRTATWTAAALAQLYRGGHETRQRRR